MSIVHFQSVVAGATLSLVKLTNADISDIQISPTPSATAGIALGGNGAIAYTGNGAPPDPVDEWFINQPQSNIGDDYEARLNVTGGDAPTAGDAVGSWLTLNTSRGWSFTIGTSEGLSGTWQLSIRRIGGTIETTADYTMSASVQPI